jgi:multidrug efflux pump subunit AcrA (membrane-fusion protein)
VLYRFDQRPPIAGKVVDLRIKSDRNVKQGELLLRIGVPPAKSDRKLKEVELHAIPLRQLEFIQEIELQAIPLKQIEFIVQNPEGTAAKGASHRKPELEQLHGQWKVVAHEYAGEIGPSLQRAKYSYLLERIC